MRTAAGGERQYWLVTTVTFFEKRTFEAASDMTPRRLKDCTNPKQRERVAVCNCQLCARPFPARSKLRTLPNSQNPLTQGTLPNSLLINVTRIKVKCFLLLQVGGSDDE